MADFKKSVDALQFIKDLSMPQQAGKIIKASDAYAPFADQGIFTAPTMADRTVASATGKLKGGMRFPHLQNVDPAYEGEVWGFGAGNMGSRLLNQFENVPADKLLLSTILGNKYMHHSNPEVSAELIKHYRKGIKDKKLSNDLRDITNRRINQLTDDDGLPIFAPDSDVTDPAFYRSLDTFDKRAAMGNIMGGVGLNEGTERKRRVANQIFDYEGLMRKMTEPSIIGAPNSSIGSRIFTLSGTKSERPDLNRAYPHLVGGLDLNVDFGQVPFQHYLKDYTDNMMQTRGKVPGWFNLTRSSDLPTQEITDQWLQHLKNQGYKDGGAISPPAASMDGDQFFQAAIKAGMSTDIGSLNKIVDLVNKGMSISEAIEALTGQTHKRDGGQVEHMQSGGVKKAIGALGELTTVTRTPTVYEIAHQVAQRNAAKPVELGGLGLHADNTAMDRAKALGFEHQTYHGTDTPDIQAFDPSKTKMWNAIFSSTDPKQASDYSRLAVSKERAKEMGHESSPNVMPLMLRNTDYATPEYLNPASIESSRRKGKAGLTHDSWAITLDPATIRSRFAAFDPAELSSPEILKAEGGSVEHMQHGGIMPRAGIYYPTSSDERSQAAGLPADFYRRGMTDVASHGYHAGVDIPAGDARLTADLMGSRYVSPQMTRDSINALRLGAEFPVGEGMLRAEVMKGLAPNVPTNVGLRYSRPFAEGGAVEHMQAGGIKKGWTVLTQLEKDYNLAKFLEQSAVKDRLYHGTGRDITSFRPNLESGATFLTPNPAFANKFAMDDLLYDANSTYRGAPSGANVMPVYAQVKNPWDYENPKHIEAVAKILDPQDRKAFRKQAPKGNWLAIEDHYPSIQQAGFDAAHVMEGGVKNLGVFNQKAIKSALGNRGTYDVTDLDITKADGGKVEHMQAGGLKTLMGEVLNRGGTYAARRLERAADEIPNLEKLYEQQALKRAFISGDNAYALMTMKPSDFERYAAPLDSVLSERSLQKIADITNFHNNGGFSDVPHLNINKKEQGTTGLPWITGHEGRHRNRVMDAAGEQAGLVQLLPRAELREPFPRRSQQEYIEALKKEMDLTGNRVKPEKYYLNDSDDTPFQRRAIDLPDLYAEGGAVHSQIGGMTPEPAGGSARQETFAAQHMEEGGDIMRSLFDHALDKGDIHEMTHAMLVKQHEAEHG